MPLFEVFAPRRDADPFATELIRERFSWGAALVPPFWAVLHGLWLEAFGWLVGLVLIVSVGLFVGAEAGFWLYTLFALWVGFAATDLRAAALERKGYAHADTRIAEDELLAERDWIEEITTR